MAETNDPPANNGDGQMPSSADWRAWLEEFGPRLLLFARQQTRTHEDAEDILQEALVKLVEKLRADEFVGGRESWMPYLYTSLRRLAIDLSRREDRRKRREDTSSSNSEVEREGTYHPWFEGEASGDETRDQLEHALKEIPQKFAEVIVMKIWGERTFAEIGEALDISQNTAASRYRYGLEALKRQLGGALRRGDLAIDS